MDILKKEVSRKEFLKYVLGGVFLICAGGLSSKLPTIKKPFETKKLITNAGYGKGFYGR